MSTINRGGNNTNIIGVSNSNNKGQFVTSSDTYEYIPAVKHDKNGKAMMVEERESTAAVTTGQHSSKNIDYTPVDPSKSYQFFEVASNDAGKSIYRQTTLTSPGKELSEVLHGQSNDSRTETPYQRYQRLQFEVEQFHKDMELLSSKESESFVAKQMNELDMIEQAKKMKGELDRLQRNETISIFLQPTSSIESAVHLANQTKLTNYLNDAVKQSREELSEKSSVNRSEVNDTVPASSQPIALDPQLPDSTAKTSSLIVTLEKRLNALESLVGVATSSDNHSITNIESTLSSLEQKVNLLDDRTIRSLTQRIRNLNHEFDTLASKKQQNATVVQMTHSSESLDDVMNKINKWNSVANQVPLIVSRLQSLKTAHDDSILFGDTIRRLTTHQTEISSILSSNDTLLNQLKEAFADNMNTIESNVQHMDQRMQALQDKLAQLTQRQQ